jgi:hypothetical protein
MAKANNNPLLKGVSGKLGDTFVIRQTRNGTVLVNVPAKCKSVGKVQLALRARFMEAVDYSRRQMKTPRVKAMYATRITKKKNSAYTVAVADYLTFPKIKQIALDDYTGGVVQPLHIFASDDFRVESVTVVIKNATGEEIERGQATLSANGRDYWIYTSTKPNPSPMGSQVSVSVKDFPGNVTTQIVTVTKGSPISSGETHARAGLETSGAKQQRRDDERDDNVKQLCREKRIQWTLARSVEKVSELRLESDAGERQYEPQRLDVFEPVLDATDLFRGKEKREQERCGHKPEDELGKAFPDYVQGGFLNLPLFGFLSRICPVDADGKCCNTEQHVLRELHDGTDLQCGLSYQRARRHYRARCVDTSAQPGAGHLLRESEFFRHPGHEYHHWNRGDEHEGNHIRQLLIVAVYCSCCGNGSRYAANGHCT